MFQLAAAIAFATAHDNNVPIVILPPNGVQFDDEDMDHLNDDTFGNYRNDDRIAYAELVRASREFSKEWPTESVEYNSSRYFADVMDVDYAEYVEDEDEEDEDTDDEAIRIVFGAHRPISWEDLISNSTEFVINERDRIRNDTGMMPSHYYSRETSNKRQ
jgi:hypothetical protein